MAERGPPPDDHGHKHEADTLYRERDNNNTYNDENDNSPASKSETTTNSNCFGRVHATYVVQAPKDQIYRVPPPENAAIAERRSNPTKNDNKKIGPCASRCCFVLLLLAVLVLVLGLTVIILTAYFRPKDPKFYVDSIDVVFNGTGHAHRRSRDSRACNVKLRSENTNDKVDVSYREGGVVSLWFRDKEIGVWQFPAFHHEHEKSTVFHAAIHRKSVDAVDRVMKEIENKQRAANVKLYLKMENITGRTERVGTWIRMYVKYGVACDVTVDSFARSSRVLSQECRTTRED